MTARVARPSVLASALEVQTPCMSDKQPLQMPGNRHETGMPDKESTASSLWDQASDAERERALHRLAAARQAEALHVSGLKRANADSRAANQAGVSAVAVASWRRRIRGMAADKQTIALLDKNRSGRPKSVWSSPGSEVLWEHFLTDYLRLERPEVTACWRRVQRIADSKGWGMPPIAAFRRRLGDLPRSQRVRGRDGAMAVMDIVPHIERTIAGLSPLEIINGDGKKHDTWVRFPSGGTGRPVVWYWQDVMSRMILAWAAGEAETAELIQSSLHEVITSYGLPGKVVIDNTRAASAKSLTGGQKARKRYRVKPPQAANTADTSAGDINAGDELPGTLKLLGIDYASTTVDRDAAGRGVGRGRAKPIERAFGDLCHKIDTHPKLAGSYTGRSTQNRPETHRMKAANWETFLAVVAECVAEHNARPGRTSEAAYGHSLEKTFANAMKVTVVRRLAPGQSRLLLMIAERVMVQNNGTVTLKIGHTPGQPRNRYHNRLLADHAGETLVARIDAADLHGAVLLHDREGRFVCAAPCLLPVGWKDVRAARTASRARRRMDTAAKKALTARRDMEALLAALKDASAKDTRAKDASAEDTSAEDTSTKHTRTEPAATRLVTGSNLPEMPRAVPVRRGNFITALKRIQQQEEE